MKKIIALSFISLTTMASVGFGTIKNTIAFAEEEVPVEVVESNENEETNKYKEMYEELVAKYREVSNYQVLGTTIGGLVASLVALGFSAIFNALNKGQVNKLYEISRKGKEGIEKAEEKMKELKEEKEALLIEFKEFKEEANNMIEELKVQNEALMELAKTGKEKIEEERQFFISIIMHSKDMVSSGAAEELIKFFKDRP